MTTRNRKPAPSPAPSPDDREILSPEELAAAMAGINADADADADADAMADASADADADADAMADASANASGDDADDDASGDAGPLLLDPAALLKALKAARESDRSSGNTGSGSDRPALIPCRWSSADIKGAGALPVPVELPGNFPARSPSGASLKAPAFVAAPKDLGALELAPCQPIRNDVLRSAVRAALLNDYLGIALHKGKSAAEGGVMPLAVLWLVLSLEPERQKVRKWAQRLWVTNGQGSICSQIADIGGRYAIIRPEGVRLVKDFYGEEMI